MLVEEFVRVYSKYGHSERYSTVYLLWKSFEMGAPGSPHLLEIYRLTDYHFCAIPDLIVTNECGFNVYIRKHNFTRVATNCLDNCYVSYEK